MHTHPGEFSSKVIAAVALIAYRDTEPQREKTNRQELIKPAYEIEVTTFAHPCPKVVWEFASCNCKDFECSARPVTAYRHLPIQLECYSKDRDGISLVRRMRPEPVRLYFRLHREASLMKDFIPRSI
jgi:hypothetical protein